MCKETLTVQLIPAHLIKKQRRCENTQVMTRPKRGRSRRGSTFLYFTSILYINKNFLSLLYPRWFISGGILPFLIPLIPAAIAAAKVAAGAAAGGAISYGVKAAIDKARGKGVNIRHRRRRRR
jgi:hypothetical protein